MHLNSNSRTIVPHKYGNKKHELKMIRQPSYRNIPTVSTTNNFDTDDYDDDEEEVPGLVASAASLDFDSVLEKEQNDGVCKGTYDYGPQRRLQLLSSKKEVETDEEKVGLFKGTYDDPLEGALMEDISAHTNDDDDDLSYDSIDYVVDDDDDDIGGDYSKLKSCDNQNNVLNTANRNLAILIDDLLKQDEFSDSSDDEDEGFFIEEKSPKKAVQGKNCKRQRLKNSYKRRFSDTVMLVDHYSLHTIDEEETSLLSDDCSRCSMEFGIAKKQMAITTTPLEKASQFIQSGSSPKIPKRATISSEESDEEDEGESCKIEEGNHSMDNLKCFSLSSTCPTSSALSKTSSGQNNILIDIESQEIMRTDSQQLDGREQPRTSRRLKPYQVKRIIFVSIFSLIIILVLSVANSIST